MKRHTETRASLVARRAALIRVLAEAEQEINRIDRQIEAREYAQAAAFESRDNIAPRCYAEIRGY